MKNYMIIAKGKDAPCKFSDAQDRAAFMDRFQAWERNLTKNQQFIRSDELAGKYKRVEQQNNSFRVIDGPFAETKEVITGFFLIAAKNMDEAVELSKECPILRFDHIEIYEIKGGQQ